MSVVAGRDVDHGPDGQDAGGRETREIEAVVVLEQDPRGADR